MKEKIQPVQFIDQDFVLACSEYFFLIDRHYPEKGVLKLVGDRYRLSGDQRTVLYRGISSEKRAALRSHLLTENITGKRVLIDGYNVLFTLINYRFGKITFISTDDILRDAGSLHGKLKDYSTLNSCIDMLIEYISGEKPSRAEIYLDSPVSHSEKHAGLIKEKLLKNGIQGDCHVLKSADWALRHGSDCILATSDTGIIEKALLPVIDLPRLILHRNYKAEFLKMKDLLPAKKIENAVDKG
jgi:hypothetical protein